jgi:hypothetical protein
MRSAGTTAVVAVVAVTLARCGAPNAARSLGANEYWLPAEASLVLGPNETPHACAGVGADAIPRGSPADQRCAWLEDKATGARSELVWPTGFVARFAPNLEVLDAAGRVAYSGGDPIKGLCVTAGASTFWLP